MDSTYAPEQLSHAASVCGKYYSKVAALTTWESENEPVRCDTCIHWNNKPCSKLNSIVGQDDNVSSHE